MWVPARAWVVALLTASGILPLQTATAATSSGILALTGHPLPIAVEGGALAEVTAHAVPFPLGSDTLADGIATALDALLATAATDCFLFAQVVGHVQPGPAADGDTRAAHRLARARAEVLAAALQRAGVPPDSVATTWDFGFATPHPRATLWLFERSVGSDCHGTPLPGAAAPAAVAAAPDAGPSAPTAVARATDRLEPAPGIHLPAPTSPTTAMAETAGSLAAIEVAAGALDPEPAPGIHLPELKVAAAGGLTSGIAIVGGSEGSPLNPPKAEIASSAPPADEARMADPEPQAGPSSSTAGSTAAQASARAATVEVTFDPDSSFLSQAALAELEAWRATLPGEARVCRVEVVAAVGDRAGRLQPERARLYNEWLAERRQHRLVEWLRTSSGCELREVHREFHRHDDSRRVVLHLSAEPAPTTGAFSRNPAPAGSPPSPTPHRA